jgi:hypothetical protein
MNNFLMGILYLAIYIVSALALQEIAKRQKHKNPWLAWIPIANFALIFQLGSIAWGWIFLILIPIAGWIAIWIMLIVAFWRVLEIEKYPGWLSIIAFVISPAYPIILAIVAWSKK